MREKRISGLERGLLTRTAIIAAVRHPNENGADSVAIRVEHVTAVAWHCEKQVQSAQKPLKCALISLKRLPLE